MWGSPIQIEQLPRSAVAHRYLVSAMVCVAVVALCAAHSAEVMHWFVVPVMLCGIMIGADAVDWVLGRRDIYDPTGIIGAIGFHAFFLAPLLHVVWQFWMGYVQHPTDWRDWIGGMAGLNFVGIVLYRGTVALLEQRLTPRAVQSRWEAHPKVFPVVITAAIAITFLAQMLIYVQMGGVTGYLDQFAAGGEAFSGMGIYFMFGEAFPIIAMIGYAVWVRTGGRHPSAAELAAVVVGFFAVKMLFGGLRGSRSTIVWSMFWCVGIVHLWVRPVPRKAIAAGLCALVVFMYVYGFYKIGGMKTLLEAMEGREAREQIERRASRTLETAILADLARADIQAYLLYRLAGRDADYDFAYGRTYVASVLLVVPRQLWPDRPDLKNVEGTRALYGMGAYVPGRFVASNVYGMVGEAMLNFGPWVVPLYFVPFGLIVGWISTLRSRLAEDDLRRLLLPVLANLCFVVLVGDSDNIVVFMFQNSVIPMLVLTVGTTKVLRTDRAVLATERARVVGGRPQWGRRAREVPTVET